MIAEPNPAELASLARTLGGRGYLPFEAESQRGALALARDLVLDLALLDAYFPDGLGLDVCAELRRATRDLRVIFLTEDPSREFRRDALSAGAYAVVPRRARPSLIVATIEAALGARRKNTWANVRNG